MSAARPRQVTVVGGGFSGAIFAHHLLRTSPEPVCVDVAEERPSLGAGLAYSDGEPHQTTNIPAPRMSVDPGDPTHFARWLAARGQHASEPEHYPNRAAFGRYMDEIVRGTVPAHPGSFLRHRRVRITGVARESGGLRVLAADGDAWTADAVALATGNPVPLLPAPLAAFAEDGRVILDPWRPGALAGVPAHARVLMLGVSLTMGEALAGLRAAGHQGPVVAIARRARRAERGLIEAVAPFGDFVTDHRTTAVGLLQNFRREVARAERIGLTWRSVLVAARAQAWTLWANLPKPERARFVRHLRRFYEALRHVMPGPVYDLLQAEERTGRLRVFAASLRDLQATPDGLQATLRRRHAPPNEVIVEPFDVVVNCTGPAYAAVTEIDPFWAGLARAGLVQPDGVDLGIAVDGDARALDGAGVVQPDLFVLGTLARGTFGELTGVVELSRIARHAAVTLVESWRSEQFASPDPSFRKAV